MLLELLWMFSQSVNYTHFVQPSSQEPATAPCLQMNAMTHPISLRSTVNLRFHLYLGIN